MKAVLERTPNLEIQQATVNAVIVEKGRVSRG